MSTIRIPAAPVHQELEVKRSKFHCHIHYAESAAAAHQLIADIRQKYPDANHVCSAYIAGIQGQTTNIGCSDDGEPNGSAGKPMLNVLMHSDLSFIVAAVARIYGGTKLGTGGLVRAYGGVVSQGVNLVERSERRTLTCARFSLPFSVEAQARHLLERFGGILESVDYREMVTMTVSMEQERIADFSSELKNASGGRSRQLKQSQHSD